MTTAFPRRGPAPEQVSAADVEHLHSKIGQLVVERVFFGAPSRQHDAHAPAGQWMPRINCSALIDATKSGAPIVPTSRCVGASCTSWRSWTGTAERCWRGGCQTAWTPTFAPSRQICSIIHLSRCPTGSCSAGSREGATVEALKEALAKHGTPAIFNSDQGRQFTSGAWIDVLTDAKIKISMPLGVC